MTGDWFEDQAPPAAIAPIEDSYSPYVNAPQAAPAWGTPGYAQMPTPEKQTGVWGRIKAGNSGKTGVFGGGQAAPAAVEPRRPNLGEQMMAGRNGGGGNAVGGAFRGMFGGGGGRSVGAAFGVRGGSTAGGAVGVPAKAQGTTLASLAGGGSVWMRGPDGSTRSIPAGDVQKYTALGAQVME